MITSEVYLGLGNDSLGFSLWLYWSLLCLWWAFRETCL